MAKTSSRKQGAPTISEPLKAATKSPSSSRATGWPTGKAPRPLLEAKAPPLKIVPQRGKAAAKTAKAAPDRGQPVPRRERQDARAPTSRAPKPKRNPDRARSRETSRSLSRDAGCGEAGARGATRALGKRRASR